VEVKVQRKTISKNFAVNPRDRAVLSVLLRQEDAGNAVSVSRGDMTVFLVDRENAFGITRGLAGGVAGGVPGGVREFDRLQAFANLNGAPAPAVRDKAFSTTVEVSAESAVVTNSATLAKKEEAPSGARVRSYFPEALYINPEIITDRDGRASISIP